jgi:hypothetical protein
MKSNLIQALETSGDGGSKVKYLVEERLLREDVPEEYLAATEESHLMYLYVFISINTLSFIVGFVAGFMLRWITL